MDTLLLATTLLALLHLSLAFCPRECVCDDYSLEAACIKSQLEVRMTMRDIIKYKFPIHETR